MRFDPLVAVLTALLLSSFDPAEAQQAGKVALVGYLSERGARNQKFFNEGLRELGYVNGQNITLIVRFAGPRPEVLPKAAAELVKLRVNIIVATSELAAQAAKKATSKIPIVVVTGEDLVRTGLVASISRPGGNITGINMFDQELVGKQLELLKETVSTASRVGVLWNSERPSGVPIFKQIKAVAPVLGIELHSMDMRWTELSPGCRTGWVGPNCPDFNRALKAAIQSGVSAVMVVADTFLFPPQLRHILELMAKTRLPAMFNRENWVRRGGLMFYGPSRDDMLRRAATYVDKILKGANPADLPVERPTKFELIVNLKTAKQIGLTIPPNVLARADRIIK